MKRYETLRNYLAREYSLELPHGDIPGTWFSKNGLPMVVRCTCCNMTMCSVSAWIDKDGYTYCGGCAGAVDD